MRRAPWTLASVFAVFACNGGGASPPATVGTTSTGPQTDGSDGGDTTTTAGPATSEVDPDGTASETGDPVDPPDPSDCVPLGVDTTQYDYDDDVAPSADPPGGLSPSQVPMFVTFGFDDNGYSGLEGSGGEGGMAWATEMLRRRTNPAGTGNPLTFDGTPARASFYYTSVYIDQWQSESPVYVKQAWRSAMDDGHEVGNHTQTHLPEHGGPMYSVEQWAAELDACNEWLTKPFDESEPAGTPNPDAGIGALASVLYGFRTPYLEYGDSTLAAVKMAGFWYDTSIEEGYQPDQDGTDFNWPFTLDNGSPGHDVQVEAGLEDPISPQPGLWEMPAYPVIVPPDEVAEEYGVEPGLRDRLAAAVPWWDSDSAKITGFDYNLWVGPEIGGFGMTKDEFVATLRYTLDLRLQGNRAPLMFGAHTDYYSSKYTAPPNATFTERQEALEEFLDYALSRPEVRVVTVKQILDWTRDPVPLGCTP